MADDSIAYRDRLVGIFRLAQGSARRVDVLRARIAAVIAAVVQSGASGWAGDDRPSTALPLPPTKTVADPPETPTWTRRQDRRNGCCPGESRFVAAIAGTRTAAATLGRCRGDHRLSPERRRAWPITLCRSYAWHALENGILRGPRRLARGRRAVGGGSAVRGGIGV